MLKNLRLPITFAFGALGVYLFASRPALLPEEAESGHMLEVNDVFRTLAHENNLARTLWTTEIVQAGKKQGLKFSEHWREDDVEAGPLPALFLRITARNLEKQPVRLGLFLGSDAPLNQANLFEGRQVPALDLIRDNGKPEFFYTADVGLHTGMFADLAVADACVTCHNEHPDAPKTDWKLNDIMGATTWTYPKKRVPLGEALILIESYRNAVEFTYSSYIAKAKTFGNRPKIGDDWPRDGYQLPDTASFMAEYARLASGDTLAKLTQLAKDSNSKDKPEDRSNHIVRASVIDIGEGK